MIYLHIALLLVHPWLHDYTEWKHWHSKYDSVYTKSIKKHGLDKRGIDVHFYRAVAVVESHQKRRLRGGHKKAFWGLFQISKQLARRYRTPRYKLFSSESNTDVFSKWLKTIIHLIAPNTKGIPYGLSKEDWWGLLYASHNTGPTPIARYIKRKIRWRLIGRWMSYVRGSKDAKYRLALFKLIPRLVKISSLQVIDGGRAKIRWWSFRERYMSYVRGSKDAKYRLALFKLIPRLVKISSLQVIDGGRAKIRWWSFRERYMIRCGYRRPKRGLWKSRTIFLEQWQRVIGLPISGVWDKVTEATMISRCKSKVKHVRKNIQKSK